MKNRDRDGKLIRAGATIFDLGTGKLKSAIYNAPELRYLSGTNVRFFLVPLLRLF